MTQPAYANTPAVFETPSPASFTITNSTIAKVVVDAYAAAAATGTLPPYYGGCTVVDLVGSSTDAVAKDITLWMARIATTQDAVNTGVMSTTVTNTLNRTAGSFITDGFLVGDEIMTFAPLGLAPNAAVDGIIGVVTAVNALTLVSNGAPFANLTPLAAGTRICRTSQHFRATVAANAGNTAAIASTGFINNAMDGSVVKTELKLGVNTMLVAGMAAAASALPAAVKLQAVVARY
jgi:hypothetical protein